MIRYSAITLFPNMFDHLTQDGVLGRAIQSGTVHLDTVFLRDFASDKRKTVDDHPAGGGDGMILRPDIVEKAILSVQTLQSYIVHLTPTGKVFDHTMAKQLAQKEHIVFLCGRYGGFDHRVTKKYAHLHVSLGDFVLSGGELACLCMMDSISRFVPSVLGNESSAKTDSFEDHLLEAPQYTKPTDFHGDTIPDVLLSGDHKKTSAFQRKEQIKQTAQFRPDLLLSVWDSLSKQEKAWAEHFWKHATGI